MEWVRVKIISGHPPAKPVFIPFTGQPTQMAFLNDKRRQRFVSILCRYPYIILDGADDPDEHGESDAVTKKTRCTPSPLPCLFIVNANDSEMGNHSVETERGL